MSKEAFEGWRSSVQPHGYTSGHPWWFDTGLQKAFNAGSQSRQPEIDALEAEVERLRERTKELKPSQYQLENWEKFV